MNQIRPDEVLPEDLLEVRYLLGVEDKTLAAFILETRRADGKPYPGPTLRNSTSLSDIVSLHSVALLLLYIFVAAKNMVSSLCVTTTIYTAPYHLTLLNHTYSYILNLTSNSNTCQV